MKKLICFVLVLVAVSLIFVACAQKKPEHLIAKVRYFDGTTDTLKITDYKAVGECLQLTADDGNLCIVGVNNVIIIQDEEYWR